jgi:hypothetical protein
VRILREGAEVAPKATLDLVSPRNGPHDCAIGPLEPGALLSLETEDGTLVESIVAPGVLLKLETGRYVVRNVGPQPLTVLTRVWWRNNNVCDPDESPL